jgi:HSP90 family molecular chaperone
VKLYVQRVFIMDDAEQLLPRYLRFVRGIIDSTDLPLNVSREMLQDNQVVESLRAGAVKRVLALLEELRSGDRERYQTFWSQFGRVLKEGTAEDHANAEQVAGLLQFATTRSEGSTQSVSLADYVARMPEGQAAIYYLTADNHATAAASPHLEVFREKGIEVLLLSDRVDEWLVASLPSFGGKALRSVSRGELDLSTVQAGRRQPGCPGTGVPRDAGARAFVARRPRPGRAPVEASEGLAVLHRRAGRRARRTARALAARTRAGHAGVEAHSRAQSGAPDRDQGTS